MRIAVDAMGGDHAPKSTVLGALAAIKENPAITVVLVGDEQAIRNHLPQDIPANIEIVPAAEVILPDDEPVRAVRRKKNSSLVVAVEMAREKKVDAMISAGNTGALMTAGLLYAGRMDGIERPALCAYIPNTKGRVTLTLDVGANMDAKPHQLVQYALMGSLYAEKVLGFKQPTVGLLNVGTEEGKGNELTKAVFPLLQEADLNFVGNVEARDVMQGACDVLVCDGFVGNVLLKAVEGAASTIFSQLKQEFTSSLINKLGAAILKPGLVRFKKKMDYAEYGGAPLLGLKSPVIKAHGSSNERAMKNAIVSATRFIQQDVNEIIQQSLQKNTLGESE
ncbi:phosphate acyltransferase PlsX [Brevibacillus sp. M2.1A]|uniref:phosphate acyltransferase PlsX n=1 Tax=Brevibacillus TaxID=55080 RepID=UPI00156AA3F3|nr:MULTISPECIES: phosphate acyltransferase PlsX [Brevibacillus]MBY0087227.1 phosphate acyltransferase PlsX [Brevibacillus brevis]MCC8436972.1 phosphate acyltransferase PlsX [Brevibacillus sp. M2.1A]MCE0449566.1 phosphate acyltransferase PlsX [Brevibacillus sp. AF8]MCM3143117.1 phosphate acyltransferase PlsX [Brevibacillus sp. MER 51]UKK99137.1 phosphate acyltransferase PlsX [Brevibacillus brevis]